MGDDAAEHVNPILPRAAATWVQRVLKEEGGGAAPTNEQLDEGRRPDEPTNSAQFILY